MTSNETLRQSTRAVASELFGSSKVAALYVWSFVHPPYVNAPKRDESSFSNYDQRSQNNGAAKTISRDDNLKMCKTAVGFPDAPEHFAEKDPT